MYTLKQRSTTGKVKILTLWVDGDTLYRKHGYEDGVLTPTSKKVKGKNTGKANETSPNEQALKELEALITRKRKEGYEYAGNFEIGEQEELLPFYPLPSSFTPSKPINDPPKDHKTSKAYFAQRKYNGVNILPITDDEGTLHFYTRGINEITPLVINVKPLQDLVKLNLKAKSLISCEFIYYNADGIESPKDLKGIINEKTTEAKATARYEKLIADGGHFEVKVFDILVYDGTDVSGKDYSERYTSLVNLIYTKFAELEPYTIENFEYVRDTEMAKELGWEGYVLRLKTGPKSQVKFTFNGKASRAGAWKLKFNKVDDYFIFETQFGNSGRLLDLPSKFHLAKYNKNWEAVDCGWCGPGTLATNELSQLAIDLGLPGTDHEQKVPHPTTLLTVEVKFASKQLETNSLEFPVILRTRPDKAPSECLIEDEPQFYEG